MRIVLAACAATVTLLACVPEKPPEVGQAARHVQKSAAAAPQRPFLVDGDVKAPTVIERVAPELSTCHGADASGNPRLTVTISERGTVDNVVVTRPSVACIDAAVVAAVRKWRFSPGTLKGRPVPVTMEFNVAVHYR